MRIEDLAAYCDVPLLTDSLLFEAFENDPNVVKNLQNGLYEYKVRPPTPSCNDTLESLAHSSTFAQTQYLSASTTSEPPHNCSTRSASKEGTVVACP